MPDDQQTGNVISGGDVPCSALPQQKLAEDDEGYVHPDTATLFDAFPFMRHFPIFGTAVVPFGPKCTMSLGVVYILSKGLARTLLNASRYAMFMKKYGVTTAVYQRISGIGSMGFSIKPLTAILSDTFAFFGYTKRWYMAVSCVAGAVCAVVYGLLPFKSSSAGIAGGMIFISVFCIANIDVLSEGHYSRLIKRHPVPGAGLISWIWALIMVGAIIASAIQGPLSDLGRPTIGIFISAGLQAFCMLFFIFNWYGEKKNLIERKEDYLFLLKEAQMRGTDSEPIKEGVLGYDSTTNKSKSTTPYPESFAQNGGNELVSCVELDHDEIECDFVATTCMCGIFGVNKEVIFRNVSVAVYGVIMTAGVIALTVLNITGTTYELLYGCIGISLILCVTGFLCIPMTIMKVNFFGWFQQVSYILISGGTDNFYMSDAACLPDGPHFTQTFYNTVGSVIGNAAGLIGVYMFARVFSKQSYRVTLACTILIQILASVFDIIMVERWNLYIGIPDHAMYIMGDAIVYEVCYMLNYMPLNMFISRLCPKGCESTIGAILMETVWPLSFSSPCDFSNLRWLRIVGHLITPLITIPAVFVLIPGTRICDPIYLRDVEALIIFEK